MALDPVVDHEVVAVATPAEVVHVLLCLVLLVDYKWRIMVWKFDAL